MIAHGLDRATIADLLDADPPLVSRYVDLAAQLQPNGFDLTLAEVATFTDPGVIGETNAQRHLAEVVADAVRRRRHAAPGAGPLPHHLQRGRQPAA